MARFEQKKRKTLLLLLEECAGLCYNFNNIMQKLWDRGILFANTISV